jgi:translocation protein SEC63
MAHRQYDTSAFYYFALTIIALLLIPTTIGIIKDFLYIFPSFNPIYKKLLATSTSQAQLQRVASAHTGFGKLNNKKFIRNVIFLIVLIFLLSFVSHLILNDGDVEQFDPYKILGISIGTTTAEIKKAYRKLSLKYHPDKNIGDKFAEEMFMTIAKAYEALTDEEAKANYEKYGNPDGRQATELSIGLPSFLLDYPKVVLVLYLITMIIGIPAFVFTFYNRESKKERRNMSVKETIVECMKSQKNKVNIVELCAVSRDCIDVVANSAVLPDRVEELSKKLGKFMPKISEDNLSWFQEDHLTMYCYCLLHVYLLRNADEIGLTQNERLLMHQVALKVPAVLSIIMYLFMDEELFDPILLVMKFQQSFIQGVWNADAFSRDSTNKYNLCPYYQLPHLFGMSAEELNSVNFKEFLENPNNHQVVESLSKNQVADVTKAVAQIPRIKHTVDIFVEEKDIAAYRETKQVPVVYEGEGLTVRVTLDDLRNEKKRDNAHVHSSVYDDVIDAGFWVVIGGYIIDQRSRAKRFILLDAPKRIAKVTPTDNVFTLRFQVHRIFSTLPFKVWIISDSYIGVDIEEQFAFEVRPADEAPAPVELSAEDLEAMKEPTQMELLFSTIEEEDSSSDEDEAVPLTKKGNTAGGNTTERKVKQGVVEEDDD